MQKRREHRAPGAGALLCGAIFCACVLLTARYLIAGYGTFLDSDMASELSLAQHLARQGALVSTTWRYSTEVRLLGTQLVYTPLMALFPNDWRLVRTLGGLILSALLSFSCYAGARMMGARRRYALLFAGLTLCPCSAVTAQMLTIGAYYVPHAVLTNLFVGLYAGALRKGGRARAALLLAASAALGAQSVRYMLCAVLPVAAAGAWAYLFPARARQALSRTGEDARRALLALLALACGAAGLIAGRRLTAALLLGGNGGYGGQRLASVTAADLPALASHALAWLLRVCGYAEGRTLLSASGLLAFATTALPPLAALLFVRASLRAREEERAGERGALLCALAAGALTLLSFVFLENLFLNRYWLPVVTLGAPALALALTLERNPALRRASLALFACLTLGLTFVQTRDSMASPERAQADFDNARALEESGMTLGYATFWNANVMTELTNGQVEVVAVSLEDGTPRPDVWLEDVRDASMSRPQERVFLLLTREEAEQAADFLSRCGAEETPLQKGLSLYEIESQRRFFEEMDAAPAAQGEPPQA